MRMEMNRGFDERLIAFFEGAMDDADSNALLDEVHSDPGKLDTFTQYLQLNEVISLSRHPSPVPLDVQQSLARRIPVLAASVPLTPSAADVEVPLPEESRWKHRTALITIGLLLLVTASYFSLDQFWPSDSGIRQVVHNDEAGPVSAAPNLHANESGAASQAAADQGAEAAEETGKLISVPESRTSPFPINKSVNPLSGNAGILHGTSPSSQAVEAIPDGRSTLVARREDLSATRPLGAIRSAGDGAMTPTLPWSEVSGLGFGELAPSISVYLQSGVQQALAERTSERSVGGNPSILLAGIRYAITPQFSAALEVGQSAFLQESLYEERKALAGGNNADILVIDRELIPDTRNWLRLQFGYHLFDMASWQFELRGGSGLLLGKQNALLFTSGIMANYPLNQVLLVRIGVQYSVARLDPGNTVALDPAAGEGIVGIIERANTARTRTSGGMEFNLGFGLHLW